MAIIRDELSKLSRDSLGRRIRNQKSELYYRVPQWLPEAGTAHTRPGVGNCRLERRIRSSQKLSPRLQPAEASQWRSQLRPKTPMRWAPPRRGGNRKGERRRCSSTPSRRASAARRVNGGSGSSPKSRMLINGIGLPAARGVTGEYVTRRENRKGAASRCPSLRK